MSNFVSLIPDPRVLPKNVGRPHQNEDGEMRGEGDRVIEASIKKAHY